MKLWYKNPAPDDDGRAWKHTNARNSGWEILALPIGNAYMGAKVFGITDRERIQINENSLYTSGGTGNSGNTDFTETYLHFGHDYSGVSDYTRDLVLDNAVSHVSYVYGGVTYKREYFTSYPDKVMVIKLTAEGGTLDFTLEPKIPYFRFEGKTGDVTVSDIKTESGVSVATLTLEGHLPGSNKSQTEAGYEEGVGTVGFNMDFEAQYRVFATGGTMTSHYNTDGGSVDEVDEYSNATISVSGAESAYIIIALGTNYEIDPSVYLIPENDKKLAAFPHPHKKVSEKIEAASKKSYDELLLAHSCDFSALFSRVKLELGPELTDMPTDEIIRGYREGKYHTYAEELLFAFGRYILISSSRSGNLPPNLQGVWNRYHNPICLNGYWSNVNTQMNFWSAFNTNLAECFESYVELYNTYIQANHDNAAARLLNIGAIKSKDEISGRLWSIETGMTPFKAISALGGRDGWANTPFMAESFWDYFDYTRDEKILKEVVLPALIASANFLTLVYEYDEKTGLYIAPNSGSPEQSTTAPFIKYVGEHPGYLPRGTTYDQSLAYSNYVHIFEALSHIDESRLSDSDRKVIERVREQIDKLDPIPIGLSGQVKEFREENYYGEIGEPDHRHISHLMSLYPASVINASTPAWLDAAKLSLDSRGESFTWGWSFVCHLLTRARTGDGNAAHNMLRREIITTVAENLCTLGVGSFQVEANLGTPSGIAEMLLQSHNGYIHPLAALPDAWASGSYSGLVARGNFTVSASWESGLAKSVTVTSGSGLKASVYYPGISGATLTDSKGNMVKYTNENKNLISFDTVKGESYTISGFVPAVTVNKPKNANYSINSQGVFHISCTLEANVASYNLYVAKDSESAYTHVGVSKHGGFIYTHPDECERMTFALTAVNAEGVESDRALLYYVSPKGNE